MHLTAWVKVFCIGRAAQEWLLIWQADISTDSPPFSSITMTTMDPSSISKNRMADHQIRKGENLHLASKIRPTTARNPKCQIRDAVEPGRYQIGMSEWACQIYLVASSYAQQTATSVRRCLPSAPIVCLVTFLSISEVNAHFDHSVASLTT